MLVAVTFASHGLQLFPLVALELTKCFLARDCTLSPTLYFSSSLVVPVLGVGVEGAEWLNEIETIHPLRWRQRLPRKAWFAEPNNRRKQLGLGGRRGSERK